MSLTTTPNARSLSASPVPSPTSQLVSNVSRDTVPTSDNAGNHALKASTPPMACVSLVELIVPIAVSHHVQLVSAEPISTEEFVTAHAHLAL